jgi:hypothetical protein
VTRDPRDVRIEEAAIDLLAGRAVLMAAMTSGHPLMHLAVDGLQEDVQAAVKRLEQALALAPPPPPPPTTTSKCGRYSLAPITVLSHLDPYDRKHTANECPIPAPSEEPCPGPSTDDESTPSCSCRGCGEHAATRWVYSSHGVGYAMCDDCGLDGGTGRAPAGGAK